MDDYNKLYTYRDVINKLESFITPKLNCETEEKKKCDGEYLYIPLGIDTFLDQLEIVKNHSSKHYSIDYEPTFVDVGSGIGSKLLLARQLLGYESNICGIEITPEYIEVAKKLVPYANIVERNALLIDYCLFDIIYFYCPLRDEKKQKQLEKRIVETAKVGAYIMANLKQSGDELWKQPFLKSIDSNVYQKIGQVPDPPDDSNDLRGLCLAK
jgi:hypothetical protein